MRKTFESEQRTYNLNPTKIVEIINTFQKRLNNEAECRSNNGRDVKPVFDLYITDENGFNHIDIAKQYKKYQIPEEFYGKIIDIDTEVADDGILESVNLANLLVADDGKKLTLVIHPLEKLATNPEVAYSVANKYVHK